MSWIEPAGPRRRPSAPPVERVPRHRGPAPRRPASTDRWSAGGPDVSHSCRRGPCAAPRTAARRARTRCPARHATALAHLAFEQRDRMARAIGLRASSGGITGRTVIAPFRWGSARPCLASVHSQQSPIVLHTVIPSSDGSSTLELTKFPGWWSTTSRTTLTPFGSNFGKGFGCCTRPAASRPWSWRAQNDVAAVVNRPAHARMTAASAARGPRRAPRRHRIIVTASPTSTC